jgi:uncharacterized protein YdeI (YjbR/CyaY-like superfamily)
MKDKRVDAYIANAEDFAKPILEYVRAVVHGACPDVEETMKWSVPFFVYRGAPLCMMSAFKRHCGFRFWKGTLVTGKDVSTEGAGQFGHVTSVSELPSKKALTGYLKKAMELNEQGVKAPKRPAKPKKPLAVPADLSAALAKNTKARATFEQFSPSHRREYIEWITGAKSDETRQRRVSQALEWMSEGKPRNWKHM